MTGFTRIAILFAPVLRIKSRTRASVTDVKRTRMASREKRTRPTDRGIRALGKTELTDEPNFGLRQVWFGVGANQPHKSLKRCCGSCCTAWVLPPSAALPPTATSTAPRAPACVCVRARRAPPRARLSALSLWTLARSRAPARDIVARGIRKPVRVVDTFSSLLRVSTLRLHVPTHGHTHTPARNTRHVYTGTRHALL